MSQEKKATTEFAVSEQDRWLIESLLTKIGEARQSNESMSVISRKGLSRILDAQEMSIIDRVFAIDPKLYGFKGPRLALEPVPETLVRVEPQPYNYQSEKRYTHVQFVPEVPYKAFQTMATAMQRQLGRTLLIESSYRSNEFQAITFLSILKINQFDVAKTAQRAAIPGYSEHSTPSQLAFDVQNIDGLPSDEAPQNFEGTQEYNWLIEHANAFDFYMSYSKDNPYGLIFEPWHWRHQPSRDI